LDIILEVFLMARAFIWIGGMRLLTESFVGAEAEAEEQEAAHEARRAAKREAKLSEQD